MPTESTAAAAPERPGRSQCDGRGVMLACAGVVVAVMAMTVLMVRVPMMMW